MKPIENNTEDYLDDILNKVDSVASATECTGLMYRPPENEQEAQSYNDIYIVPKVPNAQKS